MNTQMNQAITSQIGTKPQEEPAKIIYCLYARKSTESEEQQVLSIESQVKEMLQIAERDGLEIAEIRRESHSAKDSGQRPVFSELVEDIRKEKFNGILTWAPDRLSRNAGDLGSLVDLMDQKLLFEIRTYGQTFANSPNEKFLLMILCSQAKLENDNKSVNVKRGLRARCELGLWPTLAPVGYTNGQTEDRKGRVVPDSERAPVVRKIFEKMAHEKWSGRKIFHWLKFELNFKTRGGKSLSLSSIYLMIQNSFYYGPFEYPRGSGNWYQGISVFNKDGIELIGDYLNKKNAFIYLDPPYFEKGATLYLNHYKKDNHKALADQLNNNPDAFWLLTYDNKKEIKSLYPNRKIVNFTLNYNAYESRKGREIMIFSNALAA